MREPRRLPSPWCLAALLASRRVVEAVRCDGGQLAQCRCLLACDIFGAQPELCDGDSNKHNVVSDAMMDAVLKPNSECESIRCILECSRGLNCLDPTISRKCHNVKYYEPMCDVACEDTTTSTGTTTTATTTTVTATSSTTSTSTHSTTTTQTTTSSTSSTATRTTSTITSTTTSTSTITSSTTTTQTQTTTPHIVILGFSLPTQSQRYDWYYAETLGGVILLCVALCCCRSACGRGEVDAPVHHHLLVQHEESPRLGGSAATPPSSKLPLEATEDSSGASGFGLGSTPAPGGQQATAAEEVAEEEEAEPQEGGGSPRELAEVCDLPEVESRAYRGVAAAADEVAEDAEEAATAEAVVEEAELGGQLVNPGTESGEARPPQSTDEPESLSLTDHAGASSSREP